MENQAIENRIRYNGSSLLVADQSVAIAIRYKGTQASATITVASGDITLKHGAAAAEAADSTVGVAGVVADGTYTTLGAMVDAINKSPNWQAEIIDGLRSDVSTAALLALSEYTLSPVRKEVKGLFFDTSAFLSISYAIDWRRLNFNRSGKRMGAQPFVDQVRARCNTGSGTLALRVYQTDTKRAESLLLTQVVPADDTATSLFDVAHSLSADPGKILLVRMTGSVDLPDTGIYLDTNGYVLV
jgi:hypothetical protein